jgi:hypothetical protein
VRPGKVPARGASEMATAEVSAAGLATTAHRVPAPEVTPSCGVAAASGVAAPARVAARAGVAAPAGVALRIGQSRSTRYRNAQQQDSDGPY